MTGRLHLFVRDCNSIDQEQVLVTLVVQPFVCASTGNVANLEYFQYNREESEVPVAVKSSFNEPFGTLLVLRHSK